MDHRLSIGLDSNIHQLYSSSELLNGTRTCKKTFELPSPILRITASRIHAWRLDKLQLAPGLKARSGCQTLMGICKQAPRKMPARNCTQGGRVTASMKAGRLRNRFHSSCWQEHACLLPLTIQAPRFGRTRCHRLTYVNKDWGPRGAYGISKLPPPLTYWGLFQKLSSGDAANTFCPVGGGCFVDNVSEGWGVGR